ncbi:alpha/beta hydrolase [Micromonospora sp. MMS20-R2-29]|uniref:Alpha/beta hydrolase n=1 Tax=Micromonospora humidisoli TaxID=2807622 RepID=A0ABS2JGQ7_9ACTN|nr:alpha/beta hydrolase [Micromonospora humidisoli]MBM7085240.1 alpha/beta hydrolase [Micromonospora humidisoli]
MTGSLRLTTDAGTFDALSAGPADGRGVLLLHGFPQGAVEWEHQLAALGAAGYHAVAPDQRGYSPGVRPDEVDAYRMDTLVADVVALAGQLGWDRFDLVGHDWGAAIGWAVADRHPELLRTFTAVSVPHPRPFADALATDVDQQRRSAYLAMFRQPGQAEGMLLAEDAAFLRRMLGAAGPVKLATYLDRLTAPGALTAALNWYRATRPEDVEAGPVEVPTLYVWGSDDIGVGPVAAHGTGAWVKGPYEFLTFDGVSHWVPEEVPDRLSAALLAHLARHPG